MGDLNKNNHLNNFNDTGSSLVSRTAYEAFMEGRGSIGYAPTQNDPQGSMFVAPKEELDRVLKEADGDVSKVEKALGLPEGHFGDGPLIRVDIQDIHTQGLRVANGRESGANEYFNTKADAQGNLPNIIYVKDANGNNTRIIDTQKTDPTELSKLNGQYWDEKGSYHKPNLNGYDGKTSTGINEGVINRVSNTAENVSYTELKGFSRGESSNVTATKIQDGYSQSIPSRKDNIEKLGIPDSKAPPKNVDNPNLFHMKSFNNGGQEKSQGEMVKKDQLVKFESENPKNDGLVLKENLNKNFEEFDKAMGISRKENIPSDKGLAVKANNNGINV